MAPVELAKNDIAANSSFYYQLVWNPWKIILSLKAIPLKLGVCYYRFVFFFYGVIVFILNVETTIIHTYHLIQNKFTLIRDMYSGA